MYGLVYENIIASGVAELLPELEHYFVNSKGEVCDDPDDAGLKLYININRPDYTLFGDEFGTDTAQEDDVHVGGQTYLSFRNTRVNITTSKARNRFTVIGITTWTGESVCCVVIF